MLKMLAIVINYLDMGIEFQVIDLVNRVSWKKEN